MREEKEMKESADICFLIDTSGSMSGSSIKKVGLLKKLIGYHPVICIIDWVIGFVRGCCKGFQCCHWLCCEAKYWSGIYLCIVLLSLVPTIVQWFQN
jgi:hypothetical protein